MSSLDAAPLLDESNRKMIALLEHNPLLTQSEIAKDLHVSQSAVAVRLSKLAKAGVFFRRTALSYELLGLRMGRADVDASDFSSILKWANSCPLFINASLGIGGSNLSLLFVAEDLQMFHYIIDEHLRKMKDVRNLGFSEIVNWLKEFPITLDLNFPKRETPPCGMLPYCPKCPGNAGYNGKIWPVKDGKFSA